MDFDFSEAPDEIAKRLAQIERVRESLAKDYEDEGFWTLRRGHFNCVIAKLVFNGDHDSQRTASYLLDVAMEFGDEEFVSINFSGFTDSMWGRMSDAEATISIRLVNKAMPEYAKQDVSGWYSARTKGTQQIMATDGMTLSGDYDSYCAAEAWIHAVEDLIPALNDFPQANSTFMLQATRLHAIDHGIGCDSHTFSDLVDLFMELSVKIRLHNHVAPDYKQAILRMENILREQDGRS